MTEKLRIISDWYLFSNGETFDQIGSEAGKIIEDIENLNGARITIEKETDIAPYAVTIGVYGLLFHTHYTGTEELAKQFAAETKNRIDKLFEHLSISKENQNDIWEKVYNKLIDSICEQD